MVARVHGVDLVRVRIPISRQRRVHRVIRPDAQSDDWANLSIPTSGSRLALGGGPTNKTKTALDQAVFVLEFTNFIKSFLFSL